MDTVEREEWSRFRQIRTGKRCPECDAIDGTIETNGGSLRNGDLTWLHPACGAQWDAVEWTEEARVGGRSYVSRELCIGKFLVIEESSGEATVYDESRENAEIAYAAADWDDACDWARERVTEGIADLPPKQRPPLPAILQAKPIFRNKPCKQCPFRKKAMVGWLGEAHPESFVGTLLTEHEILPCHSTIDYSRKDWHEAWTMRREGMACAGAVATACNSGKRPRYLTAPVSKRSRAEVFARFADFIEHHRKGPIQSWTEPAPGSLEAAGRDAVREMVGLVPIGKKLR